MNSSHLYYEKVYLNNASSLVGKKEYQGPLGNRFDGYEKDEYFGCQSFEEAESEMVRRNLNLLLGKSEKSVEEVDLIIGGDLINQCTATSFAISASKIPFLGIYGACTTAIESIICCSAFIEGNLCNTAIGVASSHFCAAERQYRFPLEYGSTRTPTSQNTVTGTGAFLLSNQKSKIKIKSAVIGRIIDKGVTDANNMGAAMACAAVDTLKRFFEDNRSKPSDFDIIATGDLGHEGHSIACEMLKLDNVDLGERFTDCGILIYDKNKQDTHSGGSGCGCVGSVTAGHFYKLLDDGMAKNILVVATGALLNPNSVFQKKSIPAIAHAVHFSTEV